MAKKEYLSEEKKDLNTRKDIFWRTFFLVFFADCFIYANLSQYKWYSSLFTILLAVLSILGIIFLPGIFYQMKWVQDQYDIFQNKKWATAKDDKEKAKAKVYYNLFLFFGLSVVSYILSGVIALYVFHKSGTARLITVAVLIIISLVLSIKITETKSKKTME